MEAYSKDYAQRLEDMARKQGVSFLDLFEALHFAQNHGWKPRMDNSECLNI